MEVVFELQTCMALHQNIISFQKEHGTETRWLMVHTDILDSIFEFLKSREINGTKTQATYTQFKISFLACSSELEEKIEGAVDAWFQDRKISPEKCKLPSSPSSSYTGELIKWEWPTS
jgi:hypothetical protein